MKQYEFWLMAGTQTLYGDEVIRQVEEDAQAVCAALDEDPQAVGRVVFKGAVTDSDAIERLILAANADPDCAGIITWMHTFSPSKMWIHGLTKLQKPMLHFNTQFFREIPWSTIGMDYMNLHQSDHGDPQHGFIGAGLRIPRKVIDGHY
ncbi:MAG: L-arabinose isomerase, partial [Clostridiales bacterium]|nr:L-arabinose isomerase [Clostridiales bacterium]